MAALQTFPPSAPSLRLPKLGAGGLFLLFCAGCGPHRAEMLPQKPNPNLRVVLQTIPLRPRQLDPIIFTARLMDASGKPISAASVHLRLAMTSMDMGKNEVVLKLAGPGLYTGTGRFTMAGAWQATVTAAHGGNAVRQNFSIEVQ